MTTKQQNLRAEKFRQGFPDLRYFDADEFLTLGAGNSSGKCAGKNYYPPVKLHKKLYECARVWDEIRHRLGKPIVIISAYRSQEYNVCIGGVKYSQHMVGTAADARAKGASSKRVYNVALKLRQEGFFTGGIGLYNSFVHVDVRGKNATWGKGR